MSRGKQALLARGGPIVTLPALKSRTHALIDGRELVQPRLLPSIKRKLRAGWSYDEIRDALAKPGVDIAKSTLKDYVKQARRPSGATKKPSSGSRPRPQTDGTRGELDAGNQAARQPEPGRAKPLLAVLNDEV